MPISSVSPETYKIGKIQGDKVEVRFFTNITQVNEQDSITGEIYTLFDYDDLPLILSNRNNLHLYIQNNLESLVNQAIEEMKKEKIEKLRQKCEETIEQGFLSFNGHFYRTNRDDQTNFIGKKDEVLNDPSILSVIWKTEDRGYITHTRDEWLKVYFEGLRHKESQLFKLDNLRKAIYPLTRKKDVDTVQW